MRACPVFDIPSNLLPRNLRLSITNLRILRFLREINNYKFTVTFPSNSPVLTLTTCTWTYSSVMRALSYTMAAVYNPLPANRLARTRGYSLGRTDEAHSMAFVTSAGICVKTTTSETHVPCLLATVKRS